MHESLFEAFARLSLLNDTDKLLEKLICVLNKTRGEPWHRMEDYWEANLSDISTPCQVAGIDDDQTVIIDGAVGATIEWGGLKKVAFLKRKTIWRTAAELLVRMSPGWLIIAITTLASYRPVTIEEGPFSYKYVDPTIAVAIIFFLVAAVTAISAPWLLFTLYRGKFWSTQASFIGFEGIPNIQWVEQQLFGFCEGRLQWSPYSSTQSTHKLKETGQRLDRECEARPPSEVPLALAKDVEVRQDTGTKKVHQSTSFNNSSTSNTSGNHSSHASDSDTMETCLVDQDRLFTIVDTYTMTVTTFWAVHPPSVAFICGQEGGMQRALLCSYDYKTQTFHRETVIRMMTKVLDRMERVERFRFSMAPMSLPTRQPHL